MRTNIFPAFASLLSLLSAASVGSEHRHERTTKLHKASSIGEYEHYAKGDMLSHGYFEKFGRQQEKKIVLLGKNQKAKHVIKGFLDNTADAIKAVFIAKEQNARELIESLLDDGGRLSDLRAVLILEDDDAQYITENLLSAHNVAETFSVLLLSKYEQAQALMDGPLQMYPNKEDIKEVLVSKDNRVKDIVDRFLEQHDKMDDINVAFIGKGDDTRGMTGKLLENMAQKEIKVVLIGNEENAKSMLDTMMTKESERDNLQLTVMTNHTMRKLPDYVEAVAGDDVDVVMLGASGERLSSNDILAEIDNPSPGESEEHGPEISEKEPALDSTDTAVVARNYTAQNLDGFSEVGSHVHDNLRVFTAGNHSCARAGLGAEVATAKTSLAQVVSHLRQFVLEYGFDFHSFDTQAHTLDQQLSMVDHTMYRLLPCSQALWGDVQFAHEMFDVMADALEPMKYYKSSKGLGPYLVSAMIDLKIRLLRMRNSHGDPDPSIEGYAVEVTRCVELLNYWVHMFKNQDALSYGVQQMFERQFVQVKYMLLILADNIDQAPGTLEDMYGMRGEN